VLTQTQFGDFRIIHDDDLLKLDLENLVYILKISWFCMFSYPVADVVVTTLVVIVIAVVVVVVVVAAAARTG